MELIIQMKRLKRSGITSAVWLKWITGIITTSGTKRKKRNIPIAMGIQMFFKPSSGLFHIRKDFHRHFRMTILGK
jgi:hypothetical protein